MKLCKATIYYFSLENDNPHELLADELDSSDWVSAEMFGKEDVDIGEWNDDIDINLTSATQETYEKYFEKEK